MPILQPDQIYQLLRNLTSPVVAITSMRGGTRNGMIADSAVRASIVPSIPRVSVYIHKFNYSHDLIFETGRFVLDVGYGSAAQAVGSVMTAAYFRANMPAEWRGEYEALLRAAQQFAAERSRDIRPVVWRGLPALE